MSVDEQNCKISLRVSNNTAYLWNVDVKADIAKLRSRQHHICGILTGTLPHLSQQNAFLGVPLILLPEEVVLLVENGIAILIDDPNAHIQPSLVEIESWSKEQQALLQQQAAANEAKVAKKEQTRFLSEAAIQKRKEREERRRIAAQKLTQEATDDISTFSPVPEPAAKDEPSTASESSIPTGTYTISIPAVSDEYQWYSPQHATFSTITSAQQAGVWTYPSNLNERARCGVFRSLWEQGYFMGSGIKFGGDYLVYPGDPLRYHSHFVASVIESPTQTLRPMEIVAHGRLGTATKKSHLLCTWEDERKQVSYFSVEWAGFG